MTNIFAKVFKLNYDSFKADVTRKRGMSIKSDYNSAVHVGSTDVLGFLRFYTIQHCKHIRKRNRHISMQFIKAFFFRQSANISPEYRIFLRKF